MLNNLIKFALTLVFSMLPLFAYAQDVKSRLSYIVVDAKTGDILDEKNGYDYKYPASLTKMMTLYLLFEELEAGRISLDSRLKVSEYASSKPASKIGLPAGSTISVEDAIKSIAIKSANDIAVVVAESISGSESEFAKRMTGTARNLGMVRTRFKNASGLHDSEQVSSPFDMYKLGLALQDRFPQYYKYFGMTEFVLSGNKISGHNALVKVRGIDGIKTGYTRASGFNVVTNVNIDNKHIISVVMGSSSSKDRNSLSLNIIKSSLKNASSNNRSTPIVKENYKPVTLFGITNNGTITPPEHPFRFKDKDDVVEAKDMSRSPTSLFMFKTYENQSSSALIFD